MTTNYDLLLSEDIHHHEPSCANCGIVRTDQQIDPHHQSPHSLVNSPKLLLTVEEAAQQLSIGRPKMYALVMRGEVLSVKIGASRRIPTHAVEEYVERLSDEAHARQKALAERGREAYGH